MQKDLLKKIDTLVEMSKSTSSIDTLKAELTEINEEIETKKKDLDDLKRTMQDEKYIKASDKIIDENIKVSLELKIRKLESSRKDLEKEIQESLKKEEEIHSRQQFLEDKNIKLSNLIKTLQEKLESLDNSDLEINEYYRNLISENEKKRNKIEVERKATEEEYHRISEKLSELTSKMETLKNKISSETVKLNDTIQNLSSNDSYIDLNLKQEDERRLRELEERLDSLETRKEEIQNDAAMIGSEAKELLIEDDRTGCLLKVRELVNQLKKLPFMDIASSREVENALKEAEERAILERDEFASSIENKKYDGNDTEIKNDREKYLEEQKRVLENELKEKKEKIKTIDTIKIREISSLLSAANVVFENLKKELAEYKRVIDVDLENSTPKKKATLVAAYNKKEEELQEVQNIINAYENDIEDLMKESKYIAEIEMTSVSSKITKIENNLKEMQKKSMISSKAKDVLKMENDKTRLKELSDAVKEIMDRKKFKETPSEIYDEIEMSLGSFIEPEEPLTDPEPKPIIEENNSDFLNDFRITADVDMKPFELNRTEKNKDVLSDEESEKIKNSVEINFDIPWQEELTPEPEKTIPTPILPDVEPVNIDELLALEPKKETPVQERFKVINVEPLDHEETPENISEPTNTEDVMIGDFKDEDYIDFDSLLGGGNV